MKYLAIDWGAVRLGIAISDIEKKIAFPRPYIKNDKNAIQYFIGLIEKEGIERVYIGIPVRESGAETVSTQRAIKFYNRLRSQVKVPVEKADERYTTRIVETLFTEMKVKNAKEKKDSLSAVVLLQGILDGKNKI